jgi:hypothetical protein
LKNYYELLSLPADAPADEIKKAFRREIARYHPDKVQHLGKEFQDMAAAMAADLTEGYRVLMDPALRARYDTDLQAGASPPGIPSGAPPSPPPPPPPPAEVPRQAPLPSAGVDFVKRATVSKLREAIDEVLHDAAPIPAPFDIAVATPARKGLFRKAEPGLCLLVRLVPRVDGEAVAQAWPVAARVSAPDPSTCVLLLVGSGLAPSRDLSAAVTEMRRKSRGAGPILVPVDVRDWEALFPPDTPAPVRAVIQRLKHGRR